MPLSPELAAQNDNLEAQYRHDGRPYYTDSNHFIQPVHTDEEWQGIQQQKAEAAAAKQAATAAKAAAKAAAAQQKQQTGAAIDAARQSGRDFITSRVDGSPIYTESEAAHAAQQAKITEDLRRKAITDQITKTKALHDYEAAQSSQRILPAAAVSKIQKSLKNAQQQAITTLTGPVTQQAGQTNGLVFKEPTPEALKAQERLKALNSPDYQLTPEDLQSLEADPVGKGQAAEIQRLQGMLEGHTAAEKAKAAHERKITALTLLRDDPAEFARQEAARRQSLSAKDLGADLTASAEELQTRQQQLQQQGQAIQQQLQTHEVALSTLAQQAAQRRAQGIPAGEIVPYQNADGSLEAWPKDLAQQREVLVARQQAARLSLQPQLDAYEAARSQYEQIATAHNEGVRIAQEKQQQAVQDTITALRQNPATEGTAQALQDLHDEHKARLADLHAAYGDSPPEDQVQKLHADLAARQRSILESARKTAQDKEDDSRAATFVRHRTLRDTEEFMRLQQQDTPITAPVGSPEWKEQVLAQQKQASDFAAAKEAEHMRKAGLDPENPAHRTLIQDAEARDFSGVSNFHLPEGQPLSHADRAYSRTLSDGSVVVNPRFVQDATRYAQAVQLADATPEAKARAMADLPRLQLAHAAAMLPILKAMPQADIPGVPTFEKWQKSTKPSGSEAEQARDYLQAMDKRGFWSKLTDTSIRGILAGLADVGTQAAGAVAALTGHQGLSEWAADTSQATQNFLAPLQAEGAHSSLTATVVGLSTRLAGPVAATILLTRGLGGGMGVASAISGVQTAGAQYADTYNQLRQDGLTHDQAWKRTAPWALGSGLASAFITQAGGKIGAEAFLKSPAEIAKSAAAKTAQSLWKGMISNIPKNALGEVAEELPDELLSQISSYFATEKHPTHAGLSQVIGQFFADSPAFLGSIMLMGGAGGAHEAWQEHKATTAAASQEVPTANLPETIAAAEDAIASYQAPEGTPPEVAQATQDAAHGVLSIAQGVPLTDLDADTLASLDIVQDPQKPGTFLNGRLVTGKDGVAKIQKYEAGQAVGEDGTSRPVRVRIQDGQPVISQSTLDNLAQLMPAVRAAIPLDERSRVQQLSAAAQPQEENHAAVPATAPTPITTLPSREESASAAHQERAAQLATLLESRGLDAAQAQAAASRVVAAQGVVGSSAEEQYAAGIDKEMAAVGWHRAATAKTYTYTPAAAGPTPYSSIKAHLAARDITDTQAAGLLRQHTGSTTVKALTDDLQQHLGWTNYQRALTAATTALEFTPAKGSVSEDSSATGKESSPPAPRTRATLDPEAWVTAVRSAKSALPTAQRREGTRIIGLLEKHLFHYAGAFQKIQFATTPEEHAVSSAGGGMHVTPEGTLVLDLPRIAQQFSGLLEGPTRSQRADTALRAAVEEEVVHSVQLQLYGFDETAALFQALPPALQAEVWRSYRVTDLASRAAVQLFQKSYIDLTPEEKARADAAVVTGTPPKKWSPQHAAQLYFEFERMLVSDRVFAGRVSEAAAADPSFGKMLLDWLRNIIARLRNAISSAPQEVRTQIAQREAALVKALKTLQKSLGDSAGDALSQLKAKEAKVDLQQDNRPSITTGSTSPVELPPLPFAPVLGAKGTAYTDANDAVEYQWAVVPVSSLNISNDDTGRINPSYPQELQPRDRTTAGSEAQVADIAKNMNLSRLSASSSVGDGAPIIGPDAVAESGNGRLMGMRRAYAVADGNPTRPPTPPRSEGSAGSPAAQYRQDLIRRASEFGLNAEQVEAVPQPVLVRVRTTELNRTAFVLSANVSTIAPKREIEQAKIDAKQIVPDIFEHFVPSEDGEIFTAANADFIRTFIATLIPPAERPAVIDAAGNLTQSGLRRIRNALFVYAYGPSPETLNALSRITESLESDTLRRLPDALVALAPRFAELNGRQEAGALYPLSITSDLAWTLQKIQDLRNRGESVPDYLAQDRIPGIGDDPTPLQRQLLTYLSENAARPRQIIATLSRYASAMDGAGDPRQASLFGDTRPTREELWSLAATPREGALSTGPKALPTAPLPPQTALKLYRQLKKVEADTGRLEITQAQTLERAERALGQMFFFDQPVLQDLRPAPFRLDSAETIVNAPSAQQLSLFNAPPSLISPLASPSFAATLSPDEASSYSYRDPAVAAQLVAGGSPGTAQPAGRTERSGDRSAPRLSSDSSSPAQPPAASTPAGSAALPQLSLAQFAAGISRIPVSDQFQGQEHTVFRDAASARAIKLTAPGQFGARKSLEGYLQQMQVMNELFGDSIAIEGWLQDPQEAAPRLVTSQPWIHGRPATLPEIDSFMRRHGFLRMYDGAWWHPSMEMLVSDALPKNFLTSFSDGAVHPIDLVFAWPTGSAIESIENIVHSQPQTAPEPVSAVAEGATTAAGQTPQATPTPAIPPLQRLRRWLGLSASRKSLQDSPARSQGLNLTSLLTPAQQQAKQSILSVLPTAPPPTESSPSAPLFTSGKSLESAPRFYSRLAQVIAQKMPNRADAQTIKDIITNPQTGIKAEELKWSGILPWLDQKSHEKKSPSLIAQAGDMSLVDEIDTSKKHLQRGRSPSQMKESGKSPLAGDVVAATIKDKQNHAAHQEFILKQEVLDYLQNEGSVHLEEHSLEPESYEPRWVVRDDQTKEEYDSKEAAEAAVEEWIDAYVDNHEFEHPDTDGWSADEQDENEWIVTNRRRRQIEDSPVFDTEKEAEKYIARAQRKHEDEVESFRSKVARNIRVYEEERPEETSYSKYTIPGGEKYREVILHIPPQMRYVVVNNATKEEISFLDQETASQYITTHRKSGLGGEFTLKYDNGKKYFSGHYPDIPNYVAHMRINDRTDAAGSPGTFIEEIQSDRHQQGRQKGYREDYHPTLPEGWYVWETTQDDKPYFEVLDDSDRLKGGARTRQEAIAAALPVLVQNLIPDAPFRTTWPLQMFKRALADAVATGKQWIGWTTGQTQAERYDLSQQVDDIRYLKTGADAYTISANKNGQVVMEQENVPGSKLPDYFGKDLAQKIQAGEGTHPDPEDEDIPLGVRMLTGPDLKVGGEGMKGFYDNILPKEIGKYVKQWGASVTQSPLRGAPSQAFTDAVSRSDAAVAQYGHGSPQALEAMQAIPSDSGYNATPIWRVDITPQMRAGVAAGQALFTSRKSLAPLEETTIQGYLDLPDVSVPASKQPAAVRAIRAASSPSASYELPAARGSHRDRSRFDTLREHYQRAWQAFASKDVEALKQAFTGQDSFSTILHGLISREVPSFDIRGAIIHSAADFAAFNLATRTPYFESLKIAVVDAADQVVHSQIVHVGGLNEAVADPKVIAGIIASVKLQHPKARLAGWLIAHNHPSGDPSPSDADNRVTRRFREMGNLIGLPLLDHVITNGQKYFSYREVGLVGPSASDLDDSIDHLPRRASKPNLPVLTTPPAPSTGTTAAWEVLPSGSSPVQAKLPQEVYPYLDALRTADPGHYHILYLDTKLYLRAVERVPVTVTTSQLFQRIVLGAAREGAHSFTLGLPSVESQPNQVAESSAEFVTPSHRRLVSRLREHSKDIGLGFLDAMLTHGVFPFSFREHGLMEAPPSLLTSTKSLDSASELSDVPSTSGSGKPPQTTANAAQQHSPTANHVTDPYTGAVSFITGPRLLREQGRQIGHAHAQRLRAGLSSRRSTGPASPALAADREGILNPVASGSGQPPQTTAVSPSLGSATANAGSASPVPVLSAAQFARITALPKIGEGAEAAVHADRKAGVVYKVLNGYAPVPGLLGNPTLGVWPQLLHTADGRLDYHFAPAERPRQLAARLAVQTLMGGTPTEIAAIAPEGHIILKQPLSPRPEIGRDPDFIDNAGLSVARGRAGIVEVPSRLIADPDSPRVFLAVVEGRPWLLFDMHPDNFVGDHHGEARINDPIVAQVTADLVAKIPGLAQVIKDAAARAKQLGDRSNRLFTASKSVNSPSMASHPGAAQHAEPSPGGLSEAEAILKIGKEQSAALDAESKNRVSPNQFTFEWQPSDDPAFEGDGYFDPKWKSPIYETKYLERFVPLNSIHKHEDGTFSVGESPEIFTSLQPAKDAVMQQVTDYLADNGSTFGANMDGQRFSAEVFQRAAPYFVPYAIDGQGWGSTKWGSWYFEAKDENGGKLKLSIRDHEATRKDMGIPDKSWEVSKTWEPEDVAKALAKALEWLKANAEPLSEFGGAGIKPKLGEHGSVTVRDSAKGNVFNSPVNPESSRAGGGTPEADRLFTSTKSLDLSRAFAPTPPSKALSGLFQPSAGDPTRPPTPPRFPATANSRGAALYFPPTATSQLLLRAYAAAAVGQSSQMLPIRRVFEEAQKIQPALTPEVFLQAVKSGDNSGQVFLEPFDTPAQLTAAGPFVVRNAAGVPSISMAVLPPSGNPPLPPTPTPPQLETTVLSKSPVSPETTASTPEASPLARLGWNHLDRALSAKLAAHTRWLREPATTITKRTANNIAAHLVAMWSGKKDAAPLVSRLEAVGHSLKKELLPDSVLPREILAKKREMEIKTAMGSQRAMDLVRALSGSPKFSDIAYPKEFAENPVYRRNLYEAMSGERPLTSLPPPLQALATRLRSILVATGQEAVKQGRMSTETFDNLRTTYMPHFYKEDVQKEKSLFHKFRLGVRDILAQRTTAWHITDNEQKDSTGQPRLVSHSGNQWRFKSPEHMNAFYEDFITQQALGELRSRYGKKYRALTAADLATPSKLDPEIRGRLQEIKRQLHARYTRHKPLTIAEQEKAGLIMDPVYAIARYAAQMAHDNATAEFFNAVAADPKNISDIATPGFTEIPDNPRFGRLAGKFVQADIASQVLEMIETPTVALQVYDTLLGWWKTGKTVLNPGTHVRNVLGNLFFSQLAGASVWNPGNLTYYRQALTALRNGGADLTEAYESGVLGADFVSAELRQTLRQLLPDPATIQEGSPEEQTRASRLIMGIGKAIGRFIGTPAGAVYDKAQTLYQAEDEVFKLAAYLKAKSMLGGDTAAAAAHVRQWFPYFDNGTSGTLKLLGRTAMPFLGFYRESVRIFGEALKHRPLALAASISLPSILTFLSAMALGLDDEDLDQVRKDMRGKAGKLLGPTPLEGMPLFSILLPTRSAEGALQQFDVSAIHPFVDFLGDKVDIGHEEDWWQKTLRSFIAAGPLGSLLYSQMTGRDTFADRTFVEQNMTAGEKLAARADNLAKTLLPPLAPFGTGFTSLLHAGERSTNKTLTTRNTSQTIARSLFGLDVRSAQPDLYRLADDWRKAHGYEVQEGMDYGSTTPASRARSALFKELAQSTPNVTAIRNILKSLDNMGHPVHSEQDLNKLLFYKDPLKLIGGNKAKGITATDAQAQFRRSLHGEARQALESALTTYQEIKRKAPAILRQAQTLP